MGHLVPDRRHHHDPPSIHLPPSPARCSGAGSIHEPPPSLPTAVRGAPGVARDVEREEPAGSYLSSSTRREGCFLRSQVFLHNGPRETARVVLGYFYALEESQPGSGRHLILPSPTWGYYGEQPRASIPVAGSGLSPADLPYLSTKVAADGYSLGGAALGARELVAARPRSRAVGRGVPPWFGTVSVKSTVCADAARVQSPLPLS